MIPVHEDFKKVNAFQSVVMPSNEKLYKMYGYRQTSMVGNEEETIDMNDLSAQNVTSQYAKVSATDDYMKYHESLQSE